MRDHRALVTNSISNIRKHVWKRESKGDFTGALLGNYQLRVLEEIPRSWRCSQRCVCVCVCLWVGGCEGTIFSPHPPFSLRHTKFSREKPSNPIKLGQPLGKIGLPPQTTPLLSASLTITVCQPRLLRRDGCTTVITVGTAVQLLQLYSWYSSAVLNQYTKYIN